MITTVIWLGSIDSTISFAKKLESFNAGKCVATNWQTHGRGQKNSIWQSEYGKNILVSFGFSTAFTTENHFCISMITSVAIVSLLKNYNIEAKIKWPNDIYIQNSKIAGILIENEILGNKIKKTVIGIGININQQSFKSLLNATSLRTETNRTFNIKKLVIELQKTIISNWNFYNSNVKELKYVYFSSLYAVNGAFYKAANEIFYATIFDIDFDGRLHLLTDKQEQKSFYFKEVEITFL